MKKHIALLGSIAACVEHRVSTAAKEKGKQSNGPERSAKTSEQRCRSADSGKMRCLPGEHEVFTQVTKAVQGRKKSISHERKVSKQPDMFRVGRAWAAGWPTTQEKLVEFSGGQVWGP